MNFEHALKIEDLGIEFQRLRSEDAEMYAANWSNGHSSHLYLVGISRSGGVWRATLGIDLRYIGGVEARTRSRCADMAVYAMRAVILRGHRRTLRTLRKAKEAAEAAKKEAETPSLSPDEVVKNDDAWQAAAGKGGAE